MPSASGLSASRIRDLPWISYSLLSLLLFFPGLFLGKTFFEEDLMLYSCYVRQFLSNQLIHGHFPLWNPFLSGGMPFFAHPNLMTAYPLFYPTLLFTPAFGITIFIWIHWIIAALGMHFFLAGQDYSKVACRAGALTFACSGFFSGKSPMR
jgi:hypothetical protein